MNLVDRLRGGSQTGIKMETVYPETAADAIRGSFDELIQAVEALPPEKRAQIFRDGRLSKGVIFNLIQTTELLYDQTPQLPLPQEFKNQLKNFELEPEELKVDPFWTGNGFEMELTDDEVGQFGTDNFFDPDLKKLLVRTERVQIPRGKGGTWTGFSYGYSLTLISEEQQKRVDINCLREYTRPNASFDSPRVVLSLLAIPWRRNKSAIPHNTGNDFIDAIEQYQIVPSKEDIAVIVDFKKQSAEEPSKIAEDPDRHFEATGDKRKPLKAEEAILLSRLASTVLRKWSVQKEITDLRNLS